MCLVDTEECPHSQLRKSHSIGLYGFDASSGILLLHCSSEHALQDAPDEAAMRQELTKRFKGLLKAKTASEALLLQMEGRVTKLEAEKEAVIAQAQESHLGHPHIASSSEAYAR